MPSPLARPGCTLSLGGIARKPPNEQGQLSPTEHSGAASVAARFWTFNIRTTGRIIKVRRFLAPRMNGQFTISSRISDNLRSQPSDT